MITYFFLAAHTLILWPKLQGVPEIAITSSCSATFMCHPFNKASGQGNSQRGNQAAVLGDMSASLAGAGGREWRWEDIKGLGEKVGNKGGSVCNDHHFKGSQ